MKFSTKTLILTVALTVLAVTPVLAADRTADQVTSYLTSHDAVVDAAVKDYVKTDDGCGAAAYADHKAHADLVLSQVNAFNSEIEENHIKYLIASVTNAEIFEASRKQQVLSLMDVVKVNPGFQPQLDAAIAEYNDAVAKRVAVQNSIIEAKALFAAYNEAAAQDVLARISSGR